MARRSDQDIQADVREELHWTPDVDDDGIGVAVEDGTVALSGEVDTYAEKVCAKRAALRVRGVRALVDDLVVHPRYSRRVSDTDVAKHVGQALEIAADVPDSVKAEVDDHRVTLVGEVTWEHQRRAAERAVQWLRGVSSVHNAIRLAERPSSTETKQRIQRALLRNAQTDADAIQVAVAGTVVTLSGRVKSWSEKHEAGLAAWASPHVTDVVNHIEVVSS